MTPAASRPADRRATAGAAMGDGMPPSTIVATSSAATSEGSRDRRRRSDTTVPTMKRLSNQRVIEEITDTQQRSS